MDILALIVGFVVLVYGAEWLISGASLFARKFGVSDLIVGLTVVAFGTSLPELIVNLFASGESSELAIGNIIGSNIANILLILGVASILHPLSVHRTTVYREIVFNVGAAVVLGLLVSERFLSAGGFQGLDRIDGIILISYFVMFLYYTFGKTSFGKPDNGDDKDAEDFDTVRNTLKIIGGGAGLWLGGQWIVTGATGIAGSLGISDALIGLTVVAIGTSLPELAASIIAVRKKNVDIAVGNAVGSNLFNIFWVLGLSSLINPLAFNRELVADVGVNILVAVALFLTMVLGRYRHQISKREGIIFVSLYVAYLVFAVVRELS